MPLAAMIATEYEALRAALTTRVATAAAAAAAAEGTGPQGPAGWDGFVVDVVLVQLWSGRRHRLARRRATDGMVATVVLDETRGGATLALASAVVARLLAAADLDVQIAFNGTVQAPTLLAATVVIIGATESPSSSAPTAAPTAAPTVSPTVSPTTSPTVSPTISPTVSPTAGPTAAPTAAAAPITPAPTGSAPPTGAPATGAPATAQSAGDSNASAPATDAPVAVAVAVAAVVFVAVAGMTVKARCANRTRRAVPPPPPSLEHYHGGGSGHVLINNPNGARADDPFPEPGARRETVWELSAPAQPPPPPHEGARQPRSTLWHADGGPSLRDGTYL